MHKFSFSWIHVWSSRMGSGEAVRMMGTASPQKYIGLKTAYNRVLATVSCTVTLFNLNFHFLVSMFPHLKWVLMAWV